MTDPQTHVIHNITSVLDRPETTALLQARSLRRVFHQANQNIVAVAQASCTIWPGDRIAITGPSGSGKSTLIHLFAGLDESNSGTITWPALGHLDTLRPTQIGVALQAPGLLPPLTVVENVALPLLINDMEPRGALEAAYQTLELLELSSLADQLPEQLSGGQAQRVALARALAARPRLILADEPTGQLDHPTAQHLFNLLFTALAAGGTALVVATHDPALAERFDQVWTIRQGVLQGAPVDV